MSTAAKRRTITDIFTTEQNKFYITLYFLGEFIGNFDNWHEVDEAKREVLGYWLNKKDIKL